MKKILLFICIVCSFAAKAQFPNTITSGNSSTLSKQVGAYGANLGFVWTAAYSDTTAANLSFIKNVPGIVIRIGNDLWMRSANILVWIKISGGSSVDNTDSLFGELDNFLATNRAVNMNGKSFRWTDAADFSNYLEYKIQDNGYLEYQLQNVAGTRQTFSTSQPGYINIYTLNTTDGSNPYFYLNSSSDPGTAGFGSILSSGRRVDILSHYDSVKINLGDSGRLNISPLRTAPSTAGMKVILRGNGGGFYEIDKDSIGSGSLVFQESVVKTNDSVYLEGEKIRPRANYKAYGDSAGIAGWYKQAKVDFSSALHGYEAYYDSTGEYAEGVGVIKFREAEGGGVSCVDTTISFITGITTNAPEAGDSILFHSLIAGKVLSIVREEHTLHYDALSGYTVDEDGYLYFHPPLAANERIDITLKDSACSVGIALEAPTEDPPVDMDFDIASSLSESPANQWNYGVNGYGGNSIAAMTGSGYFQFEMPSDALVIGLDDNSSPDFYNGGGATVVWKYGFYKASGVMYVVVDGQTAASPTSIGAVGSYTHIRMRRSGTTVIIQASVGGTTYSDIHTFGVTLSGDIYVKTHQVSGTGILINPKTLGFE